MEIPICQALFHEDFMTSHPAATFDTGADRWSVTSWRMPNCYVGRVRPTGEFSFAAWA